MCERIDGVRRKAEVPPKCRSQSNKPCLQARQTGVVYSSLKSLLCRQAICEMAKAQSSLKRRADVFGQDDLQGRIAGDLRRRRRNRQESRGVAGALIKGGARDLSPIIDAFGLGQIQRRASRNEAVEVDHPRHCPKGKRGS